MFHSTAMGSAKNLDQNALFTVVCYFFGKKIAKIGYFDLKWPNFLVLRNFSGGFFVLMDLGTPIVSLGVFEYKKQPSRTLMEAGGIMPPPCGCQGFLNAILNRVEAVSTFQGLPF